MLKQLEVIDRITGKTTRKLNFAPNPLGPFQYHDWLLADNAGESTVGNLLGYASHIYSSLEWVDTDNGKRTTIRYGGYIAHLYQY